MSGAPTTFWFEDEPLRVLMVDGQPWFVAIDLCRCLELRGQAGNCGVTKRLAALSADEKQMATRDNKFAGVFGPNDTSTRFAVLNVRGVFAFIALSHPERRPLVAAFRRYFDEFILPTLRKEWKQQAAPSAPAPEPRKVAAPGSEDDEELASAMAVIRARLESLDRQRSRIAAEVAALAGV